MSEKALYVLAGFDGRTEEILSGIQNSLYERGFVGTQTRDIPMHITLGSFPSDREDGIRELVECAAASHGPFGVTFSHVGIFGGQDRNVLFIAPDIGREMLGLKEEFGSSSGWTAHTTMLIDTPETIQQAVPAVLSEFTAFSGEVRTLHLYEFWPARHILSVGLGGGR